MFVTLEIVEPQKTRRRKKRSCKLSIERVALPEAVSFYRMTVQGEKEALPWPDIAEGAGPLRCRLLLPRGITPPKESGIRAFEPKALPLRMLFNAGVAALERRRLFRKEITVVDPGGILPQCIGRLVPFASVLRVLTERPHRYAAAQRDLLESDGISLCVCSMSAPLPQQGVLISLTAEYVPRLFDGLIFTCAERRFLRAETVIARDVKLPSAPARLCPAGIDRVQFASALYECCGVKAMGELCFCES